MGIVRSFHREAVPWNLVVYTIPGVLIGGQLGPWLQGRAPQQLMIRAYGWLFLMIGIATGWVALVELVAP